MYHPKRIFWAQKMTFLPIYKLVAFLVKNKLPGLLSEDKKQSLLFSLLPKTGFHI